MSNIVNVTEYISNNLKNTDLPIDKFVLQVYRTKEGDKPYFIDENGDYWRCYLFIENSMTVDSSSDLKVLYVPISFLTKGVTSFFGIGNI